MKDRIFYKSKNIIIRSINSITELKSVYDLEISRWNPEQACTLEKFKIRYNNFKDGFILAYNSEGILVGYIYCIIKSYFNNGDINWERDSGDGTGNSHDPNGNSLFCVSITTCYKSPKGTMRNLVNAWKDLAKDFNLNSVYCGSRISGLKDTELSIHEYFKSVLNKEVYDPVMSKWMSCDMTVGSLVPNYFEDGESFNYGVGRYGERYG